MAPRPDAWPTAVEGWLLAVFALSTPVAVAAVYLFGGDRAAWAVANQLAFAAGMVGLYVAPLAWPRRGSSGGSSGDTWARRLHRSTRAWVAMLTVFTAVAFQIPHNLCAGWLHAHPAAPLAWPFFAYGLSDARWTALDPAAAAAAPPPAVWLINANDAGLGVLVGVAWLWAARAATATATPGPPCPRWRLAVLLTVFRDATLWRETVEYMWDHHRLGYPHTTADPSWRAAAVAALWLVNVTWLVAPVGTLVWAHQQLGSSGAVDAPKRRH